MSVPGGGPRSNFQCSRSLPCEVTLWWMYQASLTSLFMAESLMSSTFQNKYVCWLFKLVNEQVNRIVGALSGEGTPCWTTLTRLCCLSENAAPPVWSLQGHRDLPSEGPCAWFVLHCHCHEILSNSWTRGSPNDVASPDQNIPSANTEMSEHKPKGTNHGLWTRSNSFGPESGYF